MLVTVLLSRQVLTFTTLIMVTQLYVQFPLCFCEVSMDCCLPKTVIMSHKYFHTEAEELRITMTVS
jgi:hypothetical protein